MLLPLALLHAASASSSYIGAGYALYAPTTRSSEAYQGTSFTYVFSFDKESSILHFGASVEMLQNTQEERALHWVLFCKRDISLYDSRSAFVPWMGVQASVLQLEGKSSHDLLSPTTGIYLWSNEQAHVSAEIGYALPLHYQDDASYRGLHAGVSASFLGYKY